MSPWARAACVRAAAQAGQAARCWSTVAASAPSSNPYRRSSNRVWQSLHETMTILLPRRGEGTHEEGVPRIRSAEGGESERVGSGGLLRVRLPAEGPASRTALFRDPQV